MITTLQARMVEKNPAHQKAVCMLLEAAHSAEEAKQAFELLRKNRFLRSYASRGPHEYHSAEIGGAMLRAVLRTHADDVAMDLVHCVHETGIEPSVRMFERLMMHFQDQGNLTAMRKLYLYEMLYLGKARSTSVLRLLTSLVEGQHYQEAVDVGKEAAAQGLSMSSALQQKVAEAENELAS